MRSLGHHGHRMLIVTFLIMDLLFVVFGKSNRNESQNGYLQKSKIC